MKQSLRSIGFAVGGVLLAGAVSTGRMPSDMESSMSRAVAGRL